ncbi:Poly polymerase [Fusarium austroafricanum]|uniref:Poly polymerase n=1 Tax=Fusarium austroafricanum TaxID=2364996 RepID=A0A8H4KBH5_9HYPO|nr:Poly polymerase [Fusarium austroafricanum]
MPTNQKPLPSSPPSPPPPPPPPLPPGASKPIQTEPEPKGFLAKLESAPEDWASQTPSDTNIQSSEPYRYEPIQYFFSGTLVNPTMLAYYETGAYELAPCLIQFTDGQEPQQVLGKTFMYAGDAQELKDGRFGIKLWELQMGMRLPPNWGKNEAKSSS